MSYTPSRKGKTTHAATPAKRAAGAKSQAPQPTQRKATQSRVVGGGKPRRTGGN